MKDKIVEILEELIDEYKQSIHGDGEPPSLKHFATTIVHLYSAGEEVWNKEAIELVKKHIPNNALAKDYILELLTQTDRL